MSYNNILEAQFDDVLEVTINRPKQLNALNRETIAELHDVFRKGDEDPKTRVIIITGEGEKAFVAGADIKEFADFSVEEGQALSQDGHDKLFNFVANLGTPVIAGVNGFALGGGLELAMSCHIRVASDNAKLGLPETSLGVIPGYGGTQRLTQLVGRGKALEMIMTAGMIGADEALQYGLVNHVVGQSDLKAKCEEIAAKITKNSPSAIRSAIRSVNAGLEAGTDGYKVEVEEFGRCFGTEDFNEGTSAFLEKRKANFTGK